MNLHGHIRSGVAMVRLRGPEYLVASGFGANASDSRPVQTGIVRQVVTDPEGESAYRSRCRFWARRPPPYGRASSSFYASNQFGAVFYPEVNDEVILGFMNSDPRYPVIVGSVYSKLLPPPYPPATGNDIKGIKTRGKIEMTFDDRT